MAERSDVDSGKIALIGLFGVIITAVATLVAIVLYFNVQERIDRERIAEAAERTELQVNEILAGKPVAQPWLDPDTQRATQEAALAGTGVRRIKEESGEERTLLSIPIQQAIEIVLAEESHRGRADDRSADAEQKEVAP